jgi:aspartate kinase
MLSVLKIGGSVLRDEASYAATAEFLRCRLAEHTGERLVVIVSAQYGATNELLAEATAIADEPGNDALDLLWSTGELRSVARLTLHLQRIGVSAIPFNVHQTGLVASTELGRGACPEQSRGADRFTGTTVRPLRLLAALAASRIVIVPGFLGVSAGGTITSLGRGGSDLTAVLLATAVRADACELIKDVPGYFTADPHRDSKAQQIHDLSIDEALRMADGGCDLVQRAALAAAAHAGLHLVIRSMDAAAPVTHVSSSSIQNERSRKDRSTHHGVRHQDDSRRTAVGA